MSAGERIRRATIAAALVAVVTFSAAAGGAVGATDVSVTGGDAAAEPGVAAQVDGGTAETDGTAEADNGTAEADNRTAEADTGTGEAAGGASEGIAGGSIVDANATIRGQAAGDLIGGGRDTLASAGDVNGDGNADVLVGAPRNDTLGNDSGAAFLFYGPVDEDDLTVGDADAIFLGEQRGDWAGHGVTGGDVDGDGYSDVIVGAPRSDDNGTNAGAVYVVYGGPDLPETLVLSRADEKIVGQARTELAGYAVAAVNTSAGGPGADLLVGAPKLGERRGAAYLLSGESLSSGSVAAAETTYLGESRGDLAGRSLSAAGDVDGDGSEDLLVGAPRNDSGAADAGAAYVVTDLGARGPVTLSSAEAKLAGVNRIDRAGFDVSTAGDVDGDGDDDVAVGAPYNDRGGTQAGAVYVVPGGPELNGTLTLALDGAVFVGANSGDRAGWSVSSTGTGNASCPGGGAVFVGAPGHDDAGTNAGAVYLLDGERVAQNMNGFSSSPVGLPSAGAVLLGEAANDTAGTTVAGVDGASGEDSEDLLVGAPRNDSGGANAGVAYLLSGVCSADGSVSQSGTPADGTSVGETTAEQTADADESETTAAGESATTEGEGTASSEGELTDTPEDEFSETPPTDADSTEQTDTESGDSAIGVEVPGAETTETPTDEFGG